MHQKQPPANVATAWPGGTAGGEAASASVASGAMMSARIRRCIDFSRENCAWQ